MSDMKLPSGWLITTLGTFMNFKSGVSAPKDAFGKGVKFVNVMDIFQKSALTRGDIIGSVSITDEQIERFSVIRGDILFNGSSETPNEIAYSSVYIGDEKIVFGAFVMRGRQHKKLLLPEYAKYCFKAETVRKEIIRRGQGAIRVNIGQKDLSKIPIIIPPIEEQKRIASTLDEWARMIEKTESLIDAKERQFDWLAAGLLNKSNDGWITSPLSKIVKIKKGQQPRRDAPGGVGDYVVWNGGVKLSGYTSKYNTSANSITISAIGSCGFVNFCAERFWCGGNCYALTNLTDSIDVEFLYHFLKTREKRIMRLRAGSGTPYIQQHSIDKFEVKYPPFVEQKHIAKTLNIAKQEIGVLRALVEQYRIQKRGLMQKLLSGEWQVKDKGAK